MNAYPPWLKQRYIPANKQTQHLKSTISKLNLQTVCSSARCPNTNECFSNNNITLMILGNICTRGCGYCNIAQGVPGKIDKTEPERIAAAVKKLNLKHVVITSVTRDDLRDGGAGQFIQTIQLIRKTSCSTTIEILTPDFEGKKQIIVSITKSPPDIFAHNIETVPRLYKEVRPKASYLRSLKVLAIVKKESKTIAVKSGIIAGLGETEEELIGVIKDLRYAGCNILTIGQYLKPTKFNYKIARFVHPGEFKKYKQIALGLGFRSVESGPFVRSSYLSAKEDVYG